MPESTANHLYGPLEAFGHLRTAWNGGPISGVAYSSVYCCFTAYLSIFEVTFDTLSDGFDERPVQRGVSETFRERFMTGKRLNLSLREVSADLLAGSTKLIRSVRKWHFPVHKSG